MNWYLEVLKKYVVFQGRARRKEYWMFILINVIISFLLSLVDQILGFNLGSSEITIGILSSIYGLAVFLPSLGVAVRRLHDIGKSGWWIFISLVPLVGWIILLVYLAKNGDQGENSFGSDPKGEGTEEETV